MIQWYPGHMAKAIREIEEKIKLVDLVIILLDARIPKSSYNPVFKNLFQNKKCENFLLIFEFSIVNISLIMNKVY